MYMTAQDFVQRFMDAALDQDNTRWKAPEVIRYANDGQRDIAIYRPDAFTVSGLLDTVAGTKQTLPEGATKLLRTVRNGANGKVVKIVPHDVLDATVSAWHSAAQSAVVKNVTYDERLPREYYCYPPSDGNAKIEAVWCVEPTDIPAPTGNTKDTCTGSVSVRALFVNALLDYVLYRAYAKDAGIPGNFDKAKLRYSMYAAAMGMETTATQVFGPNANGPSSPHLTKPAMK